MFRKLHSNEIDEKLHKEILLVSEPFIKGQLLKLYNELKPKTIEKIKTLEERIEELEKKIRGNDKDRN